MQPLSPARPFPPPESTGPAVAGAPQYPREAGRGTACSPFPRPREAAPAAALRAALAATRPQLGTLPPPPPPPPGAARRRRGGAGYISRHVVAAPPPRPGTCPWKITASPPSPPPGRAAPVPADPPGCSGERPRSARRAPALLRYRAAAPGEQQMRDRLASRSRRRLGGWSLPVPLPLPFPLPPKPLATPIPSPAATPPLLAPVLPRLPAGPCTRYRQRCAPLTMPKPMPLPLGPSRRAGWAHGGAACAASSPVPVSA